jgi:hypothetical protein
LVFAGVAGRIYVAALVVAALEPLRQLAALLVLLARQIQVAVGEVVLLTVVKQVAQVALAFAACGGLNKENNDELCTYQ